ncbi:hypothetical protein [Nocardioides solisilvae]|uniref:hypothetical protein n=1 Tax=Nocardioides solisilvae TaxID=1542435 RepID=UPI000D74FF51|nr:hypothetical protein [Nocardioides solisilvae]
MVNAVFLVAVLRMVEEGVAPPVIGAVEAVAGAGGVLGALLAPFLVHRVPTGRLTVLIAWSWVPLLLPLVLWSSPWVVAAVLGAGLLLNPAGNAATQSYRVAITPERLQGRIASSSQFLAFTTIPLAPLLGGWLLEAYGGRTATALLLGAAALAALVPTLSRSVRRVPRLDGWPTSPVAVPGAGAEIVPQAV